MSPLLFDGAGRQSNQGLAVPSSSGTVPLTRAQSDLRYQERIPGIVTPALSGNALVTLSGALNLNTAQSERVIVPQDGVLHDLAVYVVASSGNVIVGIYDDGSAAGGQRTKLWDSGPVPCPPSNAWGVIADPNLPVRESQQLELVLIADNATATFGLQSTLAGASGQLPATHAPAPGGALAKFSCTIATGGFVLPAVVTEPGMSPVYKWPAIIGRIA